MLSIFRRDPVRKLEKAYQAKLQAARDVLRNGDVRGNATLIAEAEEIAKRIDELRRARG